MDSIHVIVCLYCVEFLPFARAPSPWRRWLPNHISTIQISIFHLLLLLCYKYNDKIYSNNCWIWYRCYIQYGGVASFNHSPILQSTIFAQDTRMWLDDIPGCDISSTSKQFRKHIRKYRGLRCKAIHFATWLNIPEWAGYSLWFSLCENVRIRELSKWGVGLKFIYSHHEAIECNTSKTKWSLHSILTILV